MHYIFHIYNKRFVVSVVNISIYRNNFEAQCGNTIKGCHHEFILISRITALSNIALTKISKQLIIQYILIDIQ